MSDDLTRQQIYAKGLAQTVIDEHGLEDQLFEADLRSLFRTLEKLFTDAMAQGRSEREKEILEWLENAFQDAGEKFKKAHEEKLEYFRIYFRGKRRAYDDTINFIKGEEPDKYAERRKSLDELAALGQELQPED